jgi:hypothetical protein
VYPLRGSLATLSEGENDDLLGTRAESSGHTFYRLPALDGMQNILYTLAGGAAEVACSVESELTEFDGLGKYPIGMGGDFEALRIDLEHYQLGTLRDYAGELRDCFDGAVAHLRPHAEKMCAIAKTLVDKKVLESGEVDVSFVDYAKLFEIVSGHNDSSDS